MCKIILHHQSHQMLSKYFLRWFIPEFQEACALTAYILSLHCDCWCRGFLFGSNIFATALMGRNIILIPNTIGHIWNRYLVQNYPFLEYQRGKMWKLGRPVCSCNFYSLLKEGSKEKSCGDEWGPKIMLWISWKWEIFLWCCCDKKIASNQGNLLHMQGNYFSS